MPTVSGIIFEDASASVTGLGPGQTAWLATNGAYMGALVRVEILRMKPEDLDGDGAPDVLHLVVNGAVIDANNVMQVNADGDPKAVTEKKPGVMLSALAEGTKTIAGFEQEERDACLDRLVRLMTQISIFEAIPSAY